ncbi:MAG: nucleotidyl transferase AbiEii/AbiGii toxin family protein [Saprospiraceae bacterium]|nr:nucleotidyl transferase AbiEii/AbiGii toxin family protein [Saprospiraceae bacterium]
MLFRSTVEPNTLELLAELMAYPELSELILVGGTSLALQIGHRTSVDLDLFGSCDVQQIQDRLATKSEVSTTVIQKSQNILVSIINGIKVDFVNYGYSWLKLPVIEDNIRLASKEDIAAMKINAITGRGSKKDFIDLYYLLNDFDLEEMIGLFLKKYPEGSRFLALKSLAYLDDAEKEEMPKMSHPISWTQMKQTIREKHSQLI